MASAADYFAKKETLASSEQPMNLVVVVPVAMQLFFSLGLSLIWSLFSMLQLVANIRNLKQIPVPANAAMVIDMVDKVVNFKLTEQQFFKDHVSSRLGAARDFVEAQGVVPVALGGFLFLILVAVLMGYCAKKCPGMADFIESLKAKLMWSSVFRSVIQGYFLMVLVALQALHDFDSSTSSKAELAFEVVKVAALFLFPFGAFAIIHRNQAELDRKKFKASYGTLYTQVRTFSKLSRWPLSTTSYFLLRRFMVAVTTVFL